MLVERVCEGVPVDEQPIVYCILPSVVHIRSISLRILSSVALPKQQQDLVVVEQGELVECEVKVHERELVGAGESGNNRSFAVVVEGESRELWKLRKISDQRR